MIKNKVILEMLEKKKAQAKEILTVLRKQKTGKQHEQIEKMHELDLLNEHVVEDVEEEKKENAKKMKLKNISIEDIIDITGLSKDEIDAL